MNKIIEIIALVTIRINSKVKSFNLFLPFNSLISCVVYFYKHRTENIATANQKFFFLERILFVANQHQKYKKKKFFNIL